MEGDHIKINHWLMPLAWLYGFGVNIRNLLFDCGVLRSKSFKLPVICVGNLTVGGTGKTPHTEYLIKLLSDEHQVAVLSRGYKRKSKGFVLADEKTRMSAIGDEPFQMKQKFPHIHMAVDKDRCHGIEELMNEGIKPQTDVVILDDAYQHRYVKPGMNLLLMDYHRLVYFDKMLPAGRLREGLSGLERADAVIITKCPPYLTPMDRRGIVQNLDLRCWQKVFFTSFEYGKLYPLFGKKDKGFSLEELKDKDILLVSGIASPQQLEYDLSKITTFSSLHFDDHHNFTTEDIAKIEEKAQGKVIVTTEKDASRLSSMGEGAFSKDVAKSIYVLPVEVSFMNNKQEEFNKLIKSYVSKNSRNSIIS